jgi:hypothetical protein
MDRSLQPLEWKPVATDGKHWASGPGVEDLGAPPAPHVLEPALLARVSFGGALNESAKSSGLEDQAIAAEIHISAGYMSKAMRGVWQAWAKRLVLFMRVTNSRAPAQWIAHQVGCDLVVRSTRDARIRELEAELQQLGANGVRRLA